MLLQYGGVVICKIKILISFEVEADLVIFHCHGKDSLVATTEVCKNTTVIAVCVCGN